MINVKQQEGKGNGKANGGRLGEDLDSSGRGTGER